MAAAFSSIFLNNGRRPGHIINWPANEMYRVVSFANSTQNKLVTKTGLGTLGLEEEWPWRTLGLERTALDEHLALRKTGLGEHLALRKTGLDEHLTLGKTGPDEYLTLGKTGLCEHLAMGKIGVGEHLALGKAGRYFAKRVGAVLRTPAPTRAAVSVAASVWCCVHGPTSTYRSMVVSR